MPNPSLFTTIQLARQIETIGSDILGPGRFRPGPPPLNQAHGDVGFFYACKF